MQILGILLILINIGAVVGPIAGVVIAYNGNVQEMIIPSEVQKTVADTFGAMTSPQSNSNNPQTPDGYTSVGFELPQYVSSSYDVSARTVTLILNFTNPLNTTLTINTVSADVVCHAHNFLLGHASVPNPVEIPPSQTVNFTVVFAWTDAARVHIENAHAGETTINVDLTNIVISVSGITFETPSTYNLDIPLS